MELSWLRSFVALVKHRHFGRAAQERVLSQPALTLQIQSLEGHLGTPLLRRGLGSKVPLRPVKLTDAGAEFLARASWIVRDIDEAELVVRELRRHRSPGAVCIGLTPEYRDAVVAAVAAMLQKTSKVRVVLEEAPDESQIEDGIRAGRIHLGIVTSFPMSDERFSFQRLGDAPLRLIVNMKHPLAAGKGVQRIRELARERLVLPLLPSMERILLGLVFDVEKYVPKIVLETNAAESALAYVRASPSLITILTAPQHVDRRDLAFLSFPQPGNDPIGTYLIWRGHEPRSEAARCVAEALRAQFGKDAPVGSSGSAPRR
jgi:DNA-binding transcriptional LysR family regulator